jgi:hypothetical protein
MRARTHPDPRRAERNHAGEGGIRLIGTTRAEGEEGCSVEQSPCFLWLDAYTVGSAEDYPHDRRVVTLLHIQVPG